MHISSAKSNFHVPFRETNLAASLLHVTASATVSKEQANAFFGVDNAGANSDVTVKFVFERKELKSIQIAYVLVSGKTVEMTATYTY